MTLGIVNINSCVTFKSSRINCLVIMELVADTILPYTANKHQCKLFIMCSLLNSLFIVTVTGNNNINSKNRIGDRNFHFKLPIIAFKLTQLA